MKNYAVLADLRIKAALRIEKAFDRGYDQGYHDGKLDGEAENIAKLEKKLDDEKKYEYKRGYADGKKEVAAELNFEKGYDKGYEDGKTAIVSKAKAEVSQYREGYDKGLKHGQELRAKETECAEACGMKRAWEAVRKIIDMPLADLDQVFPGWDVEHIIEQLPAKEVIEKVEAWEKKQEQTNDDEQKTPKTCKSCAFRSINGHFPPCRDCFCYDSYEPEYEEKQEYSNIDPAPPKEKQTEKNCENCGHHRSGDVGCEAGGCSLIRENWIPQEKQDASEMNVESIKVGDEVRMIGSDPKLDNCDFGVCTKVKPKTIYVMRMDGSVGEEDKEEWEKTGNHYDIQSILDKMKENEVKE